MDKGEVLEVLEGPLAGDGTDEMRVRGRALRDSAAGWVTLKSGEGAPFLKPREKPFMWVSEPSTFLSKDFEAEDGDAPSKAVRELKQDELLELLEGPRKQEVAPELVLKATVSKGAAAGWVTMRDAMGKTHASIAKDIYICKSIIAMTSHADIKDPACKVIRKVTVGEALHAAADAKPTTDGDKGLSRMKFKALKDDKEGFVTLLGNEGKVFCEVSNSHYAMNCAGPLRRAAERSAEVVQELKKGEVFEAPAPPTEFQAEPRMGVKARAVEDEKTGWITFSAGPKAPVRPWKKSYLCKAPVELTPELELPKGAQAEGGGEGARKTELGASYLVVDGPTVDQASGLRRVHVATAEEGVVGWATLRGADGKAFLEVV